MKIKTILSIITIPLATSSLQAAVIFPLLSTDSGSVTSSTLTEEDAPRTIDSALDGSGFTSTLTDANVLTVEHEPATSTDNHYLGNTGNGGADSIAATVITFDLGGAYDVTDIYLWQYHRSQTGRGLRSFDIAFSTDGGTTFGTAVAASTLGITEFTIGSTSGNSTAQQRTFSSTQSGVDAIQFSIIVNHGDTTRLGISEIRFGGTAVPEPSSTALLGLGGLAFILRRRR
jgi:hypothetical protein